MGSKLIEVFDDLVKLSERTTLENGDIMLTLRLDSDKPTVSILSFTGNKGNLDKYHGLVVDTVKSKEFSNEINVEVSSWKRENSCNSDMPPQRGIDKDIGITWLNGKINLLISSNN